MPKGPTDLTKLAIETRNLIDSQQEDFSIGQVAIMNIMICISRFIEERGEAAGIALLQVCTAAIANGQQEVDVTGVPGFMPEGSQDPWFIMVRGIGKRTVTGPIFWILVIQCLALRHLK